MATLARAAPHDRRPTALVPGRVRGAQAARGLATFDFENGTLTLTEAGRSAAPRCTSPREAALAAHDPRRSRGCGTSTSRRSPRGSRENHTLKRALTDPQLFSGIGNAYSDEILHRARLSPLRAHALVRTEELDACSRDASGARRMDRTTAAGGRRGRFPERVTAFREGMAVHGRYGKPCPVCGTTVQRIRYAENETNYCPRCQTGGRLLSDRSLARLLKDDWPRTIEELERRG